MVKVVTDTVAGFTEAQLRNFDILAASQYVVFGEVSYRDLVDISPQEFYRKLGQAKSLPTTSAPSVGDMFDIYQRILNEHPGATILSIHPSAAVSGTVRSAEGACALLPDADIRVFDSRSAALGLGLMVAEAARMADSGVVAAQIEVRLSDIRDKLRVYFLVDTLDYLAKGGRIGRAAHLVGTLLDIKPLLAMRDGVIEDCARYRTHQKAVAALVERVLSDVGDRPGLHLGVIYSADKAAGQRLTEILCAALTPEEFLIGELGPSIGVHVGPGVVGVCYYVDG